MALSANRTILNKSAFQNALAKLTDELTPATREAADKLLALMDLEGRVSVAAAHAALFPFADTRSASAQLSKLLKAVEGAANRSQYDFTVTYQGAKSQGAQARHLVFQSLPVNTDIASDLSATEKEPRGVEPYGVPMDRPDVLLLTFNQHEWRELRERFSPGDGPPSRWPDVDLPTDDLGLHGGVRVAHCHTAQGGKRTVRDVGDLVQQLAPRYVIAVGIAFGVDETKQRIGNVLASEFVVDYEHSKVPRDGDIILRGDRPRASRKLLHELKYVNCHQQQAVDWPHLEFGGLLSGEKLVDNLNYRDSLVRLANQGDIVGGEMEAAGLAIALEGKPIDWIVIKAICDFADGNKRKNKEENQRHAAQNAALIVKALIDGRGLADTTDERSALGNIARPRPMQPVAIPGADDGVGQTVAESVGFTHWKDFDYGFDDSFVNNDDAPTNTGTATALGTAQRDTIDDSNDPKGIAAIPDIVAWLQRPNAPPLYAVLGEYGMGKTFTCQRATAQITQRRKQGEALPQAIYLDLRKVATAQAPDDKLNRRGHVPTLDEVITDCMRHGVLTGAGATPTVDDVWAAIDGGAVVFFDGLDEVLNLLNERQGLIFTANLLRLHTEAVQRARLHGEHSRAAQVRLVVSCRTQFFRSLLEQNQHLTGEWRGAHDESAFRALLMLPFSDEQIRAYLAAIFPNEDVQGLLNTIASVHNLREMAGRPFTLKLITRFLPRIEQWRAQGRKVSGATLYREVAQDWLMRDKNKQHFRLEDKLQLATDLAVRLWREGQRGLTATELELWLGGWLAEQDPRAEFHGKPRELLQEDLRNATFLKRADGQNARDSRFQFAHSSLQEFLLANHLFGALDPGRGDDAEALRQAWSLPPLSTETLDFFGQLLDEAVDSTDRLRRLGQLRAPYTPQASELLMRYAQHAYEGGLPSPSVVGIDLSGAALKGWHFGCRVEPPYVDAPAQPRLDLTGARFDGANLRRSRFWYVRLDGASFANCRAAQAEWLDCTSTGANWSNAELAGSVTRPIQPASHPKLANGAALSIVSTGHSDRIEGCAITGDGTRVVSAGHDGTVRLWDTATGECLRVMTGHEGGVTSCAITCDAARVASAGHDGTVRLWDTASGECLRVMTGHRGEVRSCAITGDGTRLVSAGADGTVRLWNTASGECLRVMTGHESKVASCAITGDGTRVVSTGADGTVRLWNTASGECLRVMTGHRGEVRSCAITGDGTRVASAGDDGTVRLWDTASGECLRVMTGHERWVTSCVITGDGTRVVSAGADPTVRLWDTASGECLWMTTGHKGEVRSCAITGDGTRVVAAGADPTVLLWDTASGECLRVMTGHESKVASCAITGDGTRVVSTGLEGTVRLWDTASGGCLRVMTEHKGVFASCAITGDGTRVVSAGWDCRVRLWDTASGECLRVMTGHRAGVTSCAITGDGTRVVSAGLEGTVRLWDTASGECLRVMTEHKGWVKGCAITSDGTRVVSTTDDGRVRLWDTASGECLRVMTGHKSVVTSCAITGGGTRVVSAGWDGTVRLWDTASGECLRVMTEHMGWVKGCAITGDGTRVVSAGADGTVRLWDTASGECLRVMSGHRGEVRSCAITGDGTRVVSAGADRTVRLWDTASGECLRQTLAGELRAFATYDSIVGRLDYAEGSAWRYWAWQGFDVDGRPTHWPLDAVPGVVIKPWRWG